MLEESLAQEKGKWGEQVGGWGKLGVRERIMKTGGEICGEDVEKEIG